MTAFDDGASVPTPDREVLSWDAFGTATRDLAQAVVDSGWMPELVVAVARGGLLPAGAVAYALGIKAIGTMNVEFYTGIAQTLTQPVFLEPSLDLAVCAGKRVLVVDDVADSGRTLKLVVETIRESRTAAGADVRAAVLYTKPRSVIRPHYSWRETDLWISFPWSSEPPVSARA